MSDVLEDPRGQLPNSMVRFRTSLVVLAHAIVFSMALFMAFVLAYNFRWTMVSDSDRYRWFFVLYLPLLAIAVPVKIIIFRITGQYRGSWRYVGLRDLYDVIRASLVGTFVFLVSYFAIEGIWEIIRGHALIDHSMRLRQSSVFSLDLGVTFMLVAAMRILVRFYYEDIQPSRSGRAIRALIVGAGDAGEALLREMLRMRAERYDCVGFLDDDVPELNGRIHGVEVLGRTSDIRKICDEHRVGEVFIAVPHAPPKIIRSMVERCEGAGVRFRTIPAITDVLQGRVQVSQVREVEITDLLGRAPVELDTDKIGRELRGKRALVTGAGGSIGSEMCRQIAGYQPERLALVERSENALFEIERELRRSYPDLAIVPCVADVADRARMEKIFEAEKPAAVFHAAAHKHVPMMEHNPGEAIKNNIGGTAVVATTAIKAGVAKMVMISTDKAVNPTSMMGCSKRVAEMYVQSISGPDITQFVTVRFGNVLGSSGSVVPIFKQQIAEGGPVTVTHPDMQRYFMSITEAAQLVLQAGAMGKGGEIYVLDMGEPVKIVDLARDMITLSGLRPGIDIDISFAGIRPGEKLFEELSNEHEDIGDTAHSKIGIWKHRRDDPKAVQQSVEDLLSIADAASYDGIQEGLKRLVPEYTPMNGEEPPAPPVKAASRPAPPKVTY